MVYLGISTVPGHHKVSQIGSSEQQVLLQHHVVLRVQACVSLCQVMTDQEAPRVWVLSLKYVLEKNHFPNLWITDKVDLLAI